MNLLGMLIPSGTDPISRESAAVPERSGEVRGARVRSVWDDALLKLRAKTAPVA